MLNNDIPDLPLGPSIETDRVMISASATVESATVLFGHQRLFIPRNPEIKIVFIAVSTREGIVKTCVLRGNTVVAEDIDGITGRKTPDEARDIYTGFISKGFFLEEVSTNVTNTPV